MNNPLETWVRGVCARPWLALAGVFVLAVLSAWYAAQNFRINSDLGELIAQDASWRQYFDRYEATFPDQVNTVVVVVHGESFGAVEEVARSIESAVRADDRFGDVIATQNDAFLRDHALYYLSLDELDDMADRLAEAQPVLTSIAEDASLRGVLGLIADAYETGDHPEGLEQIVDLLEESAGRLLSGADGRIRWTDELFGDEDSYTRIVSLKGHQDLADTLPSTQLLAAVRAIVDEAAAPEGVQVLITGEVALSHEEIEAAVGGVEIAGWLSIAFLVLVMSVGVRSVKIIISSVTMLVTGVVMTAAWAMLAVGEFNTLSLVFVVMFFGLGIDFALHFSLRYQEAVNSDVSPTEALAGTTRSVGRAIVICTFTTAVGFLAFTPTNYSGLADLGIISAGGMVVAAFLTFTLLPAMYAVLGGIRHHELDLPSGERLVLWLIRHRPKVLAAVVIAGIAAGAVATRAYFDYSVLALRDEGSESMRALRLLQSEGVATDYALYVLHDERADELLDVRALDVVDGVRSPNDFVPEDQDEKRFVVDDLEQILWSALSPQRVRDPPSAEQIRQTLTDSAGVLESSGDARGRNLGARLITLSQQPDEAILRWQQDVIGDALKELAWLRRAIAAMPFAYEDLPDSIRARFDSGDGLYLSVVTPSVDVTETAKLSEFVETVRDQRVQAAGRPVIEWGVGEIVVTAFTQALLIAAASILLILALVFRSFSDALLIMMPLALAALFSLAFCVLANQPINMASVLVIPLIFGLGVDNGIHVFDRYRRSPDVGRLLHSSTPRAVLLSTLTTVGAFASLMLSPHAGTASIGVLLTIAVSLILLFTVFLLPVLLHRP